MDTAALRPTPAILCVPACHRLATASAVRLAELDRKRLLTWSAPGTPFTDLLVGTLAAAGTRVEPVESRVTGGPALVELAERGVVALRPDRTSTASCRCAWPAS